MAGNSKRDALIAEGLTEAEADYLVSGGTKTDGLNLSGDNSGGQGEGKTSSASDDTIERIPDTEVGAKDADEADNPPPPKDSPFYPQWQREKRRRQDLQAELKNRNELLTTRGNELAAEREKWARLDERLRLFREATEQPDPAAQPKVKPDREADPFGYMAWQDEQMEALRSRLDQFTAQTQERDAAVELTNAFRNDAAAYTRTNPDFWESGQNARDGAYHFLMKSRDAELQAAGYTNPQDRMNIIAADERDIVARAFHARQQNPNAPGPAQVLYNLAVARGYQKRAAPQPNGAANGASGNGAANGTGNGAARTPPPMAGETVTSQVQSIQRGQAASRSLSTAGGAPPPQGIDLAQIADMSDAEYAMWKNSLSPKQRAEFSSLIGYMGR